MNLRYTNFHLIWKHLRIQEKRIDWATGFEKLCQCQTIITQLYVLDCVNIQRYFSHPFMCQEIWVQDVLTIDVGLSTITIRQFTDWRLMSLWNDQRAFFLNYFKVLPNLTVLAHRERHWPKWVRLFNLQTPIRYLIFHMFEENERKYCGTGQRIVQSY